MIYNVFKNTYFFWVLILLSGLISCGNRSSQGHNKINTATTLKSINSNTLQTDSIEDIIIARPIDYLHLIQGKTIAVVGNQTSVVKNSQSKFTHLIDSLISLHIKIKTVFSPEHGFRGKADAGELVLDSKDSKTGLPIVSLHGKNKKPTTDHLKDIEIVIFDIQDVGVRFYTYISTMHYVMEACAEVGIPLIVIDRPNPNTNYVDGPVLEKAHKSFLGLHPVPIVYGMTIGEYAKMINGERWLKNGIQCDLKVIPLHNYTHDSNYSLAIRPSPNLPNDKAINLYPSLGLFEGTSINAGRGTEIQFQIFGAPYLDSNKYSFHYKPQANFGAKYPKQKGIQCYGLDLRKTVNLSKINLNWLIDAYKNTPKSQEFFQKTFTAHAGTKNLQQQIESGLTEKDIRLSWQNELQNFKKIRKKYLIYN